MDEESSLDQRRSTYKEIVRKAREAKNARNDKSASISKCTFGGNSNILKGKFARSSAGSTFLLNQLTALSEKNKLLTTSLVQSKHVNNGLEKSLEDFQHSHMAMLIKLNSRQVEIEDLQTKLTRTQNENTKLKNMLKNIKEMLNEEELSDIEDEENTDQILENLQQKPQRIQVFFGNEPEPRSDEPSTPEEDMALDQNISVENSLLNDEEEDVNMSQESKHSVDTSDTSFDPDKFNFNFDEHTMCGDKAFKTPMSCHTSQRSSHADITVGRKRKQDQMPSAKRMSTEILPSVPSNSDEDQDQYQRSSILTPLAPRLSTVQSSVSAAIESSCDPPNKADKKSAKPRKSRKSRKTARRSQKEVTNNDDTQNEPKHSKLDNDEENKENKSSRKTWPLPESEEKKSQENRYSECGIDSQQTGRSRRTKNRINYLEPSLGKKLRQGDKLGEGWLTR